VIARSHGRLSARASATRQFRFLEIDFGIAV
jgi:hypothetical protein